jgi:hypothetical protein
VVSIRVNGEPYACVLIFRIWGVPQRPATIWTAVTVYPKHVVRSQHRLHQPHLHLAKVRGSACCDMYKAMPARELKGRDKKTVIYNMLVERIEVSWDPQCSSGSMEAWKHGSMEAWKHASKLRAFVLWAIIFFPSCQT